MIDLQIRHSFLLVSVPIFSEAWADEPRSDSFTDR